MEEPEKLLGCKRGRSPPLDLRLNLSSVEMTKMEGSSSCVSGETEEEEEEEEERVETRAMVLVGCRRCLMYFLLSDVDPKCPKCKSTVLLDFLNDDTSSSSFAAATTNKPDN